MFTAHAQCLCFGLLATHAQCDVLLCISMFPHPTADNKGESRDSVVIKTSSTSKAIGNLQQSYTAVSPLALPSPAPEVPPQGERGWLENVFEKLKKGDIQKYEYVSLAADHQFAELTISMLPLFKEQAHSPAMIKHPVAIVRDAVEFLNPGQIPVVTFDQPLYAIAKQMLWNSPDQFDEDQFVKVFTLRWRHQKPT